ncbi:MAG: GTPase [Bacillota bacterium]|nr:50S ribosome-binding GTPase [Bacillota bacterium]
MPANLTPDYLAAEQRFREAVTPEDRLEALEEMLATIPKHKGTEKMQADIKRRMARIRAELQSRPQAARRRSVYRVEKHGAGQVVLAGPPNSGKSRLLACLSNANPEVAPYPFTTRLPLAGMMPFENVQVQLVDLPPLARDMTPGEVLGLVRAADAVLLVFDLADDDLLAQTEEVFVLLGEARLTLVSEGRSDRSRKRTLVAGNKADLPGALDNLELLEGMCRRPPGGHDPLPVLPVSAASGLNLEELRGRVFWLLDRIRVYPKAPGRKVEHDSPLVLPRGSTVREGAEGLHKDIARGLKYARIWSSRTFDGQMVPRDFVLEEGDVVEFHA